MPAGFAGTMGSPEDLRKKAAAAAAAGGPATPADPYGPKTTAPENDAYTARQNRDTLFGQAQAQGERPAPQATAGQAGMVAAPPTARTSAATVAPVRGPERTTLAPTAQAQAVAVRAPAAVTAPQFGQVATTHAAEVNGAPQDQVRQRQMALLGQLDQAAAGQGPSAAQGQLRSGTERAIAAQTAMAASARGGNVGAAQRQAAQGTEALTAQAAADSAQLKVQEQLAARQQLLGALDSTRGADIGLATTQAGLEQQTRLANVGATNAARGQELGIEAQTAEGNAARELAAGTTTATLGTGMAQGNRDATNAATATQGQLDQQREILRVQQEQAAAQANAGFAQQAGIVNAGAENDTGKLLTQIEAGRQQFNAGQGNQAAIANLDAQLKARGMDDAQRQAYIAAYLQGQGQVLQQNVQQRALTVQGSGDEMRLAGGIIEGLSSMGASYLKPASSDKRKKTDIRPLLAALDGDEVDEVAELLEKLHPAAYRYKDPKAPGAAEGERFGVMAQDLEKSRIGKSLVRDTPDGKMVDASQGVGAVLAAMAQMHQRLKKVEGKRA